MDTPHEHLAYSNWEDVNALNISACPGRGEHMDTFLPEARRGTRDSSPMRERGKNLTARPTGEGLASPGVQPMLPCVDFPLALKDDASSCAFVYRSHSDALR